MKVQTTLFKNPTSVFPAILSGVFFVIFLGIYCFLTEKVIHPHYFLGLIFIVPSLFFAGVAHWYNQHLKSASDAIFLCVYATFFGLIMFLFSLIVIPCVIFYDETRDVTDVASYERVIERSCFRNDLINQFPKEIPQDAVNAKFYYSPFAIGQGGQEIALGFQANANTINQYIMRFSKQASWIGSARDADAGRHGVFGVTYSCLSGSDSQFLEDYTVYVMKSKPYSKGWNHGENSLVVINERNDEILFSASRW